MGSTLSTILKGIATIAMFIGGAVIIELDVDQRVRAKERDWAAALRWREPAGHFCCSSFWKRRWSQVSGG